MINLLSLWESFTFDIFAHMFSVFVLAFSLIRLFNHIDKHNKALWKMKDKINELGAWRDEDMSRIYRLEQRIVKINSCKGCAPKKKVSK